MLNDEIRIALRTAAEAGKQQALSTVAASLGRELLSRFLPSTITKAVSPPQNQQPVDDPHAALLLAQLEHLIHCKQTGKDHRSGDAVLHRMWENPEELTNVLREYFRDAPKHVRKAIATALVTKGAERSPKGGATLTNQETHKTTFFPGGQWIPAQDIANATPESKAALGKSTDDKKPPAPEPIQRGSREEQRRHIANIASHLLLNPDSRTPDVYRDLAAAVATATEDGHLSIHDMRALKLRLTATFGDQRQIVSALLSHVDSHLGDLPVEEPEGSSPNVSEPEYPPPASELPPGFGVLPVSAISVDPARFQFKTKTNAEGVTNEYAGVQKFEPKFAGVMTVWRDPKDGKVYVTNGHHRLEIARRTGYDGKLLVRFSDAPTAELARAEGALINIADGRGTAIDVAKFLRDSGKTVEDLHQHNIGVNSPLVANAEALSSLSDASFEKVARGMIPQSTAIAVANNLTNTDRQDKLFGIIAKHEENGKQFTQKHIEEMARQMAAAPAALVKQETLWGDEENESDTFLERSELAAHVRGELAKEHHDFGALSSERRASATAEAGNTLNVEENKKRAQAAEVHRHAFDTLAYRKGGIADALDSGAVAIKQAKTKKEKENARKQTLAAVRTALAKAISGKQSDSAGGVGDAVQESPASPQAEPESSPADQAATDGGADSNAPSRLSATSPAMAGQPKDAFPNAMGWMPGVTPHPPSTSAVSATSPANAGKPQGGAATGSWMPGGSTARTPLSVKDVEANPAAVAEQSSPNELPSVADVEANPAVVDQLPGGKSDAIPESAFPPESIAQGAKVESEHTSDPAVAREIARDHLAEDPKYYDKLAKMEAGNVSESKPLPGGRRATLRTRAGHRASSHEDEQDAYARQSAREITATPDMNELEKNKESAAVIAAKPTTAQRHIAALRAIPKGGRGNVGGRDIKRLSSGLYQARIGKRFRTDTLEKIADALATSDEKPVSGEVESPTPGADKFEEMAQPTSKVDPDAEQHAEVAKENAAFIAGRKQPSQPAKNPASSFPVGAKVIVGDREATVTKKDKTGTVVTFDDKSTAQPTLTIARGKNEDRLSPAPVATPKSVAEVEANPSAVDDESKPTPSLKPNLKLPGGGDKSNEATGWKAPPATDESRAATINQSPDEFRRESAKMGDAEARQHILGNTQAFGKPGEKINRKVLGRVLGGYDKVDDYQKHIDSGMSPEEATAKVLGWKSAGQPSFTNETSTPLSVADVVKNPASVSEHQSELASANASEPVKANSPAKPPHVALADTLAERLKAGTLEKNELWKHADKHFGGTRAEGKYGPSDAYDSLEAGLNKSFAGQTDPTADLASAQDQARHLEAITNALPTQTNRSGNKESHQQFSTPPHYAFAANWVANLKPSDHVLEPSAGTGSLAVHAQNSGATVHANEIDDKRADFLRDQFGTDRTHVEDAEQIAGILPKRGVKPTVVVMNPPFSQTAGRMGDKKDLMTGARHIEEAGRTLAPGGRLVAIVGGGTKRGDSTRGAGMSPDAPTYRDWFRKMGEKGFTLRANVGVPGDEYKKYGTHFGTRMLVFDKTPPQPGNTPVTGDAEDIPDLMAKLEEVRNDRPDLANTASGKPVRDGVPEATEGADQPGDDTAVPTGDGVAPASTEAGTPVAGVSGGTEGSSGTAGGGRSGVGDESTGVGLRATRKGRGEGKKSAGEKPTANATPDATTAGTEGKEDRAGGGKVAGGKSVPESSLHVSRIRPPERIRVEPIVEKNQSSEAAPDASGESMYENYSPSRMKIPGAKSHASKLVESAAMAAVQPPIPTYRPMLSPDVVENSVRDVKNPDGTITRKPIGLSEAGLESVAYAGQSHNSFLQAAEGEQPMRRGYFIGDGTGCIAAGTRIYNPITKEHVPVEVLLERGQPHTVLALTPNGFKAFQAEVPYLKGREELYRVTMESGRQVTVTAKHRFLTPEGWFRICDGLTVGHSLASAEALPSCSSECSPSTHGEGDRHSSRTTPSCRGGYSTCSCLCGGRLPLAEDSDRELPPLPTDVLERTLSRSRTDDRFVSTERTRLRQRFDRHSKSSSFPTWNRAHVLSLSPCDAFSSQQSVDSLRGVGQFPLLKTARQSTIRVAIRQWFERATDFVSRSRRSLIEWRRRETLGTISHDEPSCCTVRQSQRGRHQIDNQQSFSTESCHQAAACVAFSCQFDSRWDRIRAIDFVRIADFYDFGVPGPENYVAEGLVHHNSGKGRQIAGIMADNKNQGRKKHVWITEKDKLFNDAKRDWADLGENPDDMIHWDKLASGDFKRKDGVAFATYSTLRSGPKDQTKPRNIDRLIDWLGKDFDGVIAFDESHNAGNADDTVGSRGTAKASQQALAMMKLQRALPNARIVYSSATGATKPENLAYAERLGLWGRGTAFDSKGEFLKAMHEGGTSAMEAVAQSLKARGLYNARSLSYDGVKTDRLSHNLTDEQKYVYDNLAEGWQHVLQNVNAALEHIAGGKEEVKHAGQAKSAAMSQFQGAQQRFFNQVITSMMVPTVIKNMERDLKEGRSPVVQLVNTMEAATKRALSGREEGDDLEGVDLSPKQTLIDFLKNSFPVHRLEKQTDEDGNVRMVVAKDSQGNPIEDPDAVAKRDELMARAHDMKIPQSPLDQIINHFGHENVAEATGRTVRLVNKPDETGTVRLTDEKRNPKLSNETETRAFQSGKKKAMIFSEAGGTGASYHADRNAKNQNQRSHYLLQPGWRADKAVQGLGRTHRTNQSSAPIFHLLETPDVPGQKRFVSTIAKRLGQLGALTRGQAKTGGGVELFNAADNLESNESQKGLESFINSMKRGGSVNDMGYSELMGKLGFKVDDDAGGGGARRVRGQSDVPEMRQFLNRVLALKLADQQEVFRQLDDHISSQMEQARAAGTLDNGVEKFNADKVTRKGDDQTVYRDPETGAEAKLVSTVATRKSPKRAFIENSKGKLPLKYVRSDRSGKVWAVYDAAPQTDARNGSITPMYTLRGPSGTQHIPQHRIDSQNSWQANYKKLEHPEAEKLWNEQHAKLPDTTDSDEHFVTGDTLSVWDKLPQNAKPKIYRVGLHDGTSIVGRHVPATQLEETLKRLGATQSGGSADFSPANVHSKVLSQGHAATLANGWKLRRALVGGEHRIELEGPIGMHRKTLEEDGVNVEKIAHKERYFVPTGSDGVKVIERVLRSRNSPVTDLKPPARD